MRLLLLILLLPLFSEAQIINASHPYRVRATAGGCSYLLDQYTGATAAYSLRKLDCDYSGSAIRVRRSSDNTESDIGFINGNLDTATLKTFVGTGGSDDGFVVTWYDQSGNGYNAAQATSVAQPSIIDNGVVQRNGSNPTIKFGTTQNLIHTIPNITGSYSWFCVLSANAQTSYRGIFATGSNSTNGFMVLARLSAGSAWGTYGAGSNQLASSGIQTSTIKLLGMVGTINSSGSYYLNSSSDGTYAGSEGQSEKHIGGNLTDVQGFSGNISELLLWNSSPSRAGIESNINTYYSIY